MATQPGIPPCLRGCGTTVRPVAGALFLAGSDSTRLRGLAAEDLTAPITSKTSRP